MLYYNREWVSQAPIWLLTLNASQSPRKWPCISAFAEDVMCTVFHKIRGQRWVPGAPSLVVILRETAQLGFYTNGWSVQHYAHQHLWRRCTWHPERVASSEERTNWGISHWFQVVKEITRNRASKPTYYFRLGDQTVPTPLMYHKSIWETDEVEEGERINMCSKLCGVSFCLPPYILLFSGGT